MDINTVNRIYSNSCKSATVLGVKVPEGNNSHPRGNTYAGLRASMYSVFQRKDHDTEGASMLHVLCARPASLQVNMQCALLLLRSDKDPKETFLYVLDLLFFVAAEHGYQILYKAGKSLQNVQREVESVTDVDQLAQLLNNLFSVPQDTKSVKTIDDNTVPPKQAKVIFRISCVAAGPMGVNKYILEEASKQQPDSCKDFMKTIRDLLCNNNTNVLTKEAVENLDATKLDTSLKSGLTCWGALCTSEHVTDKECLLLYVALSQLFAKSGRMLKYADNKPISHKRNDLRKSKSLEELTSYVTTYWKIDESSEEEKPFIKSQHQSSEMAIEASAKMEETVDQYLKRIIDESYREFGASGVLQLVKDLIKHAPTAMLCEDPVVALYTAATGKSAPTRGIDLSMARFGK